jgi:divalent metal cation (Fe/Co/Zn/Cd) transporter
MDRAEGLRRAKQLNRISIGWNVVEAGIAVAAGLAAGSISLIGFGLDSVIEVSASAILAWRLHQERHGGCTQEADRRATRAIAVSFAVLAVYVGIQAGRDLIDGASPESSIVGIVLAVASLLAMPALARAKHRVAPVLGSRAQVSEADQTSLCAVMSGVLLVGLVANGLLDWWWADPLAGLGIAMLAAVTAVRTWRAESLADTCCH